MIILIAGATHTGKTRLAQKLLERYKFPYLSVDHLKMGLIRSGQTDLTPQDDEALTPYLWNILKEIVKTAIENKQNLIVEGCYIPYNWAKNFDEFYRKKIRYLCLIFSERYIDTHYDDIVEHASDIERRIQSTAPPKEFLKKENTEALLRCKQFGCPYLLIENNYPSELPSCLRF